jgi:hypothetical protein
MAMDASDMCPRVLPRSVNHGFPVFYLMCHIIGINVFFVDVSMLLKQASQYHE